MLSCEPNATSCFSCVFEKMFKVKMKERYEETVEMKEVDEKSMKILLDCMYTGHIDINYGNVVDILAAANYLQLKDVKQFSLGLSASCTKKLERYSQRYLRHKRK